MEYHCLLSRLSFFFIFSTFYLFPAPASSTPSPNSSLHSSLPRPLPGPLPFPSPLPPFSSILQLQCNVIYFLSKMDANEWDSILQFVSDGLAQDFAPSYWHSSSHATSPRLPARRSYPHQEHQKQARGIAHSTFTASQLGFFCRLPHRR